MGQFLARRLLLLIPTLVIISMMVFTVIRLMPGDVVTRLLEDTDTTALEKERLREMLGLKQPLHVQYIKWVGQVLRGDLGRSLFTSKPTIDELRRRLPVTLELALLSTAIAIIIGIPIGILAAIRQDSPADYLARSAAIAGLSIPGFWLATMLMLMLALWVRWSPPVRYSGLLDNPRDNLQMMAIPALVLGLNLGAALMRMTRATLLEVLRQDYVRTAWAKGLRERVVVARHALKNALIPVVAILGIQLAGLLGGTVIMERIFLLPGLGRHLLDSFTYRDYPSISSVSLLIALFVLFMNLAVDFVLRFLDPRIKAI